MDVIRAFLSAFTYLGNGPLAGPALVPVRLAAACVSVLPVAGAGLSVFTQDGIRIPIGASDEDAATAERLQFTAAEGPCIAAHASGQPVVASESVLADQWPLFHHGLITRTPFRAVTSLPLQNGLAPVATMDLFFHHSEDAYRIDMGDVDTVLDHISVVLLHEVPAVLGTPPEWLGGPVAGRRDWVFLALGMLNVARELSTPDALAVLRARAFADDRSIDETARAVVNDRLLLD